METKYLALKLFKSTNDASGVGESTELDYQEIATNILLKFIDVLEGVLIIVAGIFVMRLVRRYLQRIETMHERQQTALNLFEKITSGFIIVISITLGLKVIGLDLTLLVSVLTLGLSFGLRDVIKNYVAGLLILFKSPFEIGDVVKIRSFTGKIEKIEFQSTTIRTFDKKEITIHNSDVLTQPITNFSKTQQSRMELSIQLGYGSDMRRAQQIFDRILSNHPAVLKSPKYSIVFKTFGDLGIDVLIRFWVQKPCNILKVRSDLALAMQEAFDEEKLLAPYSREAGLDGTFGMSEARRERLKIFYGQPMLADIAGTVLAQVAGAVNGNGAAVAVAVGEAGNGTAANGALGAVPVEEYADAEEPE